MNLISEKSGKVFLFLLLGAALAGCPPKQAKVPETAEEPVEETTEAPQDDLSKPSLDIGTDWVTVPSLRAAYFDYNKAELKPEGRDTLKRNAEILRAILEQAPSVKIRIEGHCDERGTLEYNLALGQRRANAVKAYYASLGLRRVNVDTISYGEERPICSDTGENCWWRNRRGETTLKSDSPIRIPLDKLPQTAQQ